MAGGQMSKIMWRLCISLVGPLAVVYLHAAQVSGQSIATYNLTVTNSWSQASHESWAPRFSSVSGPHFSHLGGGTHNSSLSIWQDGGLSSPGMIYMQETGWIDHSNPATVDLKSEFETHIADGSAYSFLNYPRHFSPLESPVTVSLDVSSTHPLVTLVSMLGPSPDWFIGVSGLNMRDGGDWLDTITVDLFTYNGGSRSNDETFLCCENGPLESPQKAITLFTDTPDVNDPLRTALTGDQIGTFTFELEIVSGRLLPGDFDEDGQFTVADIDMLTEAIFDGADDSNFDLTGDGMTDLGDVGHWLSEAAAQNGFAQAYLPGDSNLDGTVDSSDLNNLALTWQQTVSRWSGGDFTADGIVNSSDLNRLALNWQQSVPMATLATASVPESASMISMLFVIAAVFAIGRNAKARAMPRSGLCL